MILNRLYKKSKAPAPAFKTGLVLAGGGARAAYQVGVLKAIAELTPKDAVNPFPVISGTSAGAINGAALAIYARQFHEGVFRLCSVWENFHVPQVYRADALGVLKNSAWWMTSLLLGGLGKHNPQSLLDREPLYDLLYARLPCHKIQKSIDAGVLHAFGVTASGYNSGQSVTFFQGHDSLEAWSRVRRLGAKARITVDHLMASSALPFIFSAVKINREYFGDGSMRQMVPLSSALHMGADRLLIIGVRQDDLEMPERPDHPEYPSMAQVAGHTLNSIFLDSMEADLERLSRINDTVSLIPGRKESATTLRRVETLVIAPSKRLDVIAAKYANLLPWTVGLLFRGIGGRNKDGSSLLSYLLFEREYCQALIELGYQDAMVKQEDIVQFLNDPGYTSPLPEDMLAK